MKLTAPPPGSAPELPPEPLPADAPSLPSSPSEPAIPYQKPPDKIATWPTWFGPADIGLAVLVLVLAFLGSSFAARNSDIWLHLAAGKRLTTGEYKLGTDPFSYTASERTWVNHSWLFDVGAFTLFSGEGFLLVILKAFFAAGAFGLLLCIRRPGQPLWPWTVLIALGVLASSNMLTMRPYVGSVFFLALTLLIVFRMPSPAGSWRLPLAIVGVFALWSNIDGWFILGPASLLLLLIGEVVRTSVFKQSAADAADPVGTLPDVATLGKVLAVGIVACMLNPHHIGVWELPFELMGGGGAETDPRVRVFLLGPLKQFPFYWETASLGQNVGGIAYALLLLSGLYAAFLSAAVGRFFGSAAEVEPLPIPHMLLWVGFATLSLLSMFAIPFLAIVTIPLVASRCNLFTSRVRLGTWSDRGSRMLLTGSTGGRLATVLALLLLCVAAWPGWLHPPASCWWESGLAHPANTRRVEWRVESDPDMQRAAEWLNDVRTSGNLPAEARGFASSFDFANYCAWFAPKEKVFANSRLVFHRPELAEYAKARRGLGAFTEKAEPPDPRDLEDVLAKWKASYVAIAWQRSDTELSRILMTRQEILMWLSLDQWSPWYFNGRSAISGWRPANAPGDSSFLRLEMNAAAAAYGADVPRVPAVKAEPPIVQQSVWDELFIPRKPTPTGVEEASTWLTFKMRARKFNEVQTQTGALLRLNQPGLAVPILPQALFLGRDELLAANQQLRLPPPADGSYQTYTILALRAARRAIAENPDHPDGYYALAQALADRDLIIPEGERSVALATAYQMCLARLPKPADYRRNFYSASPTEVAETLAMMYLGRRFESGDFQGHQVDMGLLGELARGGVVVRLPAGPQTGGKPLILRVPSAAMSQLPQGSSQLANGLYVLPLDLAQQLLATAEEYAKVESPDAERRTGELKRIAEARKVVDASYRTALTQFRNFSEKNPKLRDRHRQALLRGLIGESLKMLNEADLDKDYGEEATGMYFEMIAMQLAIGRLEEASALLAALRNEVNQLAEKPGSNKQLVRVFQLSLANLELQKLTLEGNYAEAGKELESLEGSQIGFKTLMEAIAKNQIDPAKYKEFDRIGPLMGSIGVAWPMIPMFAIPVYGPGEPIAAIAAYLSGRAYLDHFQHLADARNAILQKMQRDADFFYRRGFLALLEGDIAGAKVRFEGTRIIPPPGWGLPNVRHVGAENFLKQIEAASKYKKP